MNSARDHSVEKVDVAIVGAGFAGLYLLDKLRRKGFSVKVLEAGADIGGVWYWNCYPGARVDSPGALYQFSDPELWKDFNYSELYPSWKEVRSYFQHVDRKLDLSRDVRFNSRVSKASFDAKASGWSIECADGSELRARFFLLCTGFSSKMIYPEIEGLETFAGARYHTGEWPQNGLDLTGKRVGVIGTGASGVQIVQEAGPVASHLTVFQRTPNLTLPMRQRQLSPAEQKALSKGYAERFAGRDKTFGGIDYDFIPKSALEVPSEERRETYRKLFEKGGFAPWLGTFYDVVMSEEANNTAYEYWRETVLARVKDPATAEKLAPAIPPHPFGIRRPSLEQRYYEVYNQDNVDLIDLKQTPIQRVVPEGVMTSEGLHKLDVLVLATGFDAITGGLTNIDIRGTDGQSLKEKWAKGANANLGYATAGFPNMLMVYGPQSPGVFCNGPSCSEFQGAWIVDCLTYIRDKNFSTIESTQEAETAWAEENNAIAAATLFPRTRSWYFGDNVAGKPRQVLSYLGGLPTYLSRCSEVAEQNYKGFRLA